MSVQSRVIPPRWRKAVAAVIAVSMAGLVAPFVAVEPAAAETVREAQWFLRSLKMDQVHKITKGAGVTVAVVDGGIEADHPDLKGQVKGGSTPGGAAGGALIDDTGHGTSMAGLIAGKGGGANNALGIAPEAKLLSVRLSENSQGLYVNEAGPGIRWAVDNGAQVINLSFGSQADPLPATVDAVKYALSKNVVVVAAAGNRHENQTDVVSPARLPGVIAVGASGKDGKVIADSVTGPALAVVAPGERMVTTGSKRAGDASGYVQPTGTSPATAVVSGVVALIRSKYPSLSAADVVNRLIRTADDMGPAGRDPDSGFGGINALRALTENVANTGVNPLDQGAAPSGPAATSTPEEFNIRPRSWWRTRIQIFFAVVGGFVLLMIVVPVLLVRRSRRRRRQQAAAWGPPGSGPPRPGGWPGQPPGGPHGGPGFSPPTGGWAAPPPGAQHGPPTGAVQGPPTGAVQGPPTGAVQAPPTGAWAPPPAGGWSDPTSTGAQPSPPGGPQPPRTAAWPAQPGNRPPPPPPAD